MTRIRFKGFSLNRLSQTKLLAESGHPSDVSGAEWIAAFLSSCPPLASRREMRGFTEAFAVGLPHQSGVVGHQAAGHRADLIGTAIDGADRHNFGGGAAQEHLA